MYINFIKTRLTLVAIAPKRIQLPGHPARRTTMSTRIRARAEAATPFGRNRKNACNCVTARCTRFAWSKKRSFRDQKADKSSIKMTGSRTLYRSLCLRCHGRSGKKSCHHAFRMPANRIQNRVIRLRDKSIIRIFLHLNEVFCAEPLMALCLDSQQRRGPGCGTQGSARGPMLFGQKL